MGKVTGSPALPTDILSEVLMRLTRPSDCLRFGAVCTCWNRAEVATRGRRPSSSSSLLGLMIPGPDSETRLFYSLSDDKIYTSLRLPVPKSVRCVGSSHGWLVIIANELDMSLFHPVSGTRLPLPPANKLNVRGKQMTASLTNYAYVSKAVLSSSSHPTAPLVAAGGGGGGGGNSDLVVMIIHSDTQTPAFARPGDLSWTFLAEEHSFHDLIFYKEHFYVVGTSSRCRVSRREIRELPPYWSLLVNVEQLVRVEPRCAFGSFYIRRCYLVESMGELFLLIRIHKCVKAGWREEATAMDLAWLESVCDQGLESPEVIYWSSCESSDDEDWAVDEQEDGFVEKNASLPDDHVGYKTIFFSVHKMDVEGRKWVKTDSLEDRSIFLGWNASFSVKASDIAGCKPNCIYFTDDDELDHCHDTKGGHDNGFFSLDDKSIRPLLCPDPLQSPITIMPPPIWLALTTAN